MDKKRLGLLLDKVWVGKRLERFWISHGFETKRALEKKTGLTNLGRHLRGDAFPRYENLVEIAHACGSDLATLASYLDPGSSPAKEVDIPAEYIDLVRNLVQLLRDGDELHRNMIIAAINVAYRDFFDRR